MKFTPAHSAGFFVMALESKTVLNIMTQPVVEVIPEGEISRPIFQKPNRIFIGGDNNGRASYALAVFPGAETTPVSYTPDEPKDPDEKAVARHKISEVFASWGHLTEEKRSVEDVSVREIAQGSEKIMPGDLIIGSDTRTHILTAFYNKPPDFVSFGKPTNEDDLWKTFITLSNIVLAGEIPTYRIQAASGVCYMDYDQQLKFQEDEQVVEVQLKPDKIREFTTDRKNLNVYIDQMRKLFKDSEAYKNKAAGLSIEVLLKMGFVDNINGQTTEALRYDEQALRTIVQIAAIGTSPRLLALFEGAELNNGLNVELINNGIEYLDEQ